MIDHNKIWRSRNPEKVAAYTKVNRAIRSGRLIRQPCDVCGNGDTHAHHNDYSRPLDVQWLCHSCHVNAHHGDPQKRKIAQADRRRKYEEKRLSRRRIPAELRIVPKRSSLRDEAVCLRCSGMSYLEIAKKLGISKGHAYKCVNDTDYG